MSHDPFGNLEDWGRVLVTLKELTEQGRLDEAQAGIIRLLRYRDNWRLKESALVAARQIGAPSEALVSAVLRVLEDGSTFVDARILAAKALGDLGCRDGVDGPFRVAFGDCIRSVLERQLESPEAPVLTRAIEEAMRKIDGARVGTR